MTQTSARFQFPDEQILVIRPSFNTICCGVRPAAKVLSYLCYQYNNSKNPVLDENGGFTVRRTQDELVEATCNEFDKKTLHDTAIPWLMLIGLIDLIENQGTTPNEYIVYPGKVQEALNLCNKPQALHDWLKNNSRLEVFLIDELPVRLEVFPIIDKKFFQSRLEKVRIWIRSSSNHKRGRKARKEAAPEGVSESPKIIKDNKDNKKDSKRAAASASAPTDQPTNKSSGKGKQATEGKPPKQQKLPVVLSPGAQKVWDIWCRMPWFKGKPPKLTETAAAHCEDLIKYEPTYESMLAVKTWATSRKVDRNLFYQGKAWGLFWLVQEYPKWLSSVPTELIQPAPEEQQPAAPDPNQLVYWSRFEHAGTPQDNWYLYELMPEAEAIALCGGEEDYRFFQLTPDDSNVITARYKMLEIGEMTLPAGVRPDAPAWRHVPAQVA